MIVGICKIELMVLESNSLKDKRMVIKSILGRINSKFKASASETNFNDLWNQAEIGIACVSTTIKHANEMLDKITYFIDNDGRVEILNRDIEYVSL